MAAMYYFGEILYTFVKLIKLKHTNLWQRIRYK